LSGASSQRKGDVSDVKPQGGDPISPSGAAEPPKLTRKLRVFVEEYLITWNATEACRRAGYNGNTATLASIAYKNMRRPAVVAQIKRRMAERAMQADEVLARLADQARVTMADFASVEDGFDPDTGTAFQTVRLRTDQIKVKGHLIKKLKQTKEGWEIGLYDGQTALIHLGKHHKLFTDLTESQVTTVQVPDEQHDRAISTLADALRDIVHPASGGQENPLDPAEQAPVAGLADPGG
jgi:hypothetical protein